MHRYDTLIHRRLTGTFRLAARVRAGNQNHSEWSTWTSERGKRIRLPRICRCLAVLSPGSGLVRWNRFIECDGCLHLLFSCLFPAAFCLTSPTSSTSPRYHAPPFQSISLGPVRYRTGIGKVRDGSEAGRQRCAKGDSGSSESYLWLGISKSVSVVFLPGTYTVDVWGKLKTSHHWPRGSSALHPNESFPCPLQLAAPPMAR
ncbi:uncharacterized protein CCOS01_00642 [Colletotrichum costaricense]|uniref:Uncharacterized protein n=2 Tax=Colletotrichum acutatum species complex TaxID=2707335 RepID=A0AAJ0E860_9PEZI|nr:uncharacterized protein CCOS01_00642 [Colletotrichum costaricense]XP_060384089.1 uncharacterized protein CTAM01_05253 [Colletotrichum tamarilloi]KAK1502440.1 hypothetical protein CTAM01_05253 [Colletotrichum tamarilloi]KAK1539328.1 hypothetical protein CCOS01_00642 [Colletotrichum costaricense]